MRPAAHYPANTALKSTENATTASRPKRHVRRARPYARYYSPDSYYYHRGGGWPTDNMADEMNRTELENYGYAEGRLPYGYAAGAPQGYGSAPYASPYGYAPPYPPYGPPPRAYYPWGY